MLSPLALSATFSCDNYSHHWWVTVESGLLGWWDRVK